MKKISILFVGDSTWPEFHELKVWTQERASLILANDVKQAVQVVAANGCLPDVIVLLTIRPDQFSNDEVLLLNQQSPLSPVVALLGSWCEGGGRTSRPMPAVTRVYWHRWKAYFSYELNRINENQLSTWALPQTTAEDEWLSVGLDVNDKESDNRQPEKLLLINSKDFETGSALSDAFRCTPFATIWSNEPSAKLFSPPTAILWDSWALCEKSFALLNQLHNCYPQAPILALVNYPRKSDEQKLFAAGASAVITKPYQMEHLQTVLNEIIAENDLSINRTEKQSAAA